MPSRKTSRKTSPAWAFYTNTEKSKKDQRDQRDQRERSDETARKEIEKLINNYKLIKNYKQIKVLEKDGKSGTKRKSTKRRST